MASMPDSLYTITLKDIDKASVANITCADVALRMNVLLCVTELLCPNSFFWPHHIHSFTFAVARGNKGRQVGKKTRNHLKESPHNLGL